MAKYKGRVVVLDEFEFEFEADDWDLAKDHFEKLVEDGNIADTMDFMGYSQEILGIERV